MNNEQFRKLLLANSSKSSSGTLKDGGASTSPPAATRPAGSVALGSRMKSSIPMTPRSVAGSGARVDFARQLAERNQAFEKTTANKKFRTSAPKGSKLASGYVDRARTRQEQEDDERAARLAALEESLKKEEIDQATYDRIRSEIAGGDLSSTHLVKGLDFKLLQRVKRGEDVYNSQPTSSTDPAAQPESEEKDGEVEDVIDDELERLEATEVHAITREKTQKKGRLAPTSALNPGQKRSRNQILAELKAAREAAKAKEESSLGSKFKKIGAKKQPGTRIERDGKGREVMIIVDEDGHERRKVRKVDPTQALKEQEEEEQLALRSDKVLGMEVPEFYRKQQEEKEEREREEEEKEPAIFDDVESDYDPLAALEEGSDDDKEDGEVDDDKARSEESEEKKEEGREGDMPPPGGRNYFKDSKTALTSEDTYQAPSLNDPSFLAALKKAKAISSAAERSEEDQRAVEREERLKKKLLDSSRDDADLDMGFGSSRIEDEADLEESSKVKLSAWSSKDEDDDDDEGGGGGGGGKSKKQRKRGGGGGKNKKKGGDKNSFADVMKVIERNKGS
ncbi:protein Red [Diplogelasinospora grovesii]|uniref:Protein Red n=1 Tax=Diplogelasinospora grovesii TaxID=303347 RepID=A0AAN6NB53_9PEZI|nr:protein Red [Diplogelasinospora grovesii]